MERQRSVGRKGFDFTHHMGLLCADVCDKVPQFSHVDMSRVALSFSQTRKNTEWGMYASLTPLRFADGATETVRRGRRWKMPRYYDPGGTELLYILSFYLPRFFNLSLREKIVTAIHELWHIGPKFDGDLRRYPGRCFAHGSRQSQFDEEVEALVRDYLLTNPSESMLAFLRLDFNELQYRHGGVFGCRIPKPHLIPVG